MRPVAEPDERDAEHERELHQWRAGGQRYAWERPSARALARESAAGPAKAANKRSVAAPRDQEIEAQLASYDDLVRERDSVRRALGELRGDSSAARPADGARAAGRQPGSRRRVSGRRAKRGSSVRAIVDYVSANPGSTTAEIAAGTGIDRSIVYSATSRLASDGRLRRAPKGDRQVGYEAPAGEASAGAK